jgi:hypothetical protein
VPLDHNMWEKECSTVREVGGLTADFRSVNKHVHPFLRPFGSAVGPARPRRWFPARPYPPKSLSLSVTKLTPYPVTVFQNL